MIRVAVVDDHALVLAGLNALLATVDDIELIASAPTAEGARRIGANDRPDVLILDINLPDGSGIDVVRVLRRTAPTVAVLMLTMHDDDQSVLAAMRAGARGYVVKTADPEEVLRAVRSVAEGGAVLGAGVAHRALDVFAAAPRTPPFPSLTVREQEVLELIAQGVGNATIARRLGMASKTVSNHVTNIFAKLQVSDRSAAIIKARENGLGRA
ncbi:response regulator [Nocardioides ungokensis]|uniref:response regulator n=1 Tax=Nocardioides ungokensis TaxID=1643322 RepID=UPI0015DEEDF6|nr:response regulator transcription factor [Nocardioides ungokensis]